MALFSLREIPFSSVFGLYARGWRRGSFSLPVGSTHSALVVHLFRAESVPSHNDYGLVWLIVQSFITISPCLERVRSKILNAIRTSRLLPVARMCACLICRSDSFVLPGFGQSGKTSQNCLSQRCLPRHSCLYCCSKSLYIRLHSSPKDHRIGVNEAMVLAIKQHKRLSPSPTACLT